MRKRMTKVISHHHLRKKQLIFRFRNLPHLKRINRSHLRKMSSRCLMSMEMNLSVRRRHLRNRKHRVAMVRLMFKRFKTAWWLLLRKQQLLFNNHKCLRQIMITYSTGQKKQQMISTLIPHFSQIDWVKLASVLRIFLKLILVNLLQIFNNK